MTLASRDRSPGLGTLVAPGAILKHTLTDSCLCALCLRRTAGDSGRAGAADVGRGGPALHGTATRGTGGSSIRVNGVGICTRSVPFSCSQQPRLNYPSSYACVLLVWTLNLAAGVGQPGHHPGHTASLAGPLRRPPRGPASGPAPTVRDTTRGLTLTRPPRPSYSERSD